MCIHMFQCSACAQISSAELDKGSLLLGVPKQKDLKMCLGLERSLLPQATRVRAAEGAPGGEDSASRSSSQWM